MIQRIQSVYLLLGCIAISAPLFIGSVDLATGQPWFTPSRIALTVLAAVVGLVAIALFKDRGRQRTVALFAQILALLLLIVLVVTVSFFRIGTDAAWTADTVHVVSVVLPAVAYILFSLARRAIDKDEALVKSMDRLRD